MLIEYNKARKCKCGKINPKKFPIQFNEFTDNKSLFLKKYIYIQKFREEFTIKDAKIFIQQQSLNDLITPVCICFLQAYEYINNEWILHDDDKKLNDTKFNEQNIIYMYIIGRKCTCNLYDSIKEKFDNRKKFKEQEEQIKSLKGIIKENEKNMKEKEEQRKREEEKRKRIEKEAEETFNNKKGLV